MNKMKTISLAALLAFSMNLVTPKKADAGIIIMATGPVGGAAVIFMGFMAGGGVGYHMGPLSRVASKVGLALTIVGAATMIVDAEDAINMQDEFQTIPNYIFDEIEQISISRSEDAIQINEKISEVVFTHQEVDNLFDLIDGEASNEDLSKLRSILTTQTL